MLSEDPTEVSLKAAKMSYKIVKMVKVSLRLTKMSNKNVI
jgi:hypothetical protein